jgi:Leucine-rich repeat (LRR) protein
VRRRLARAALATIVWLLSTPALAQCTDAKVQAMDAGLLTAISRARPATTTVSSPVTCRDLAALTTLDAQNLNIGSIAGLEYATNLTLLNLSGNGVRDLTPLEGLTNLNTFLLANNLIDDLTPLLKNVQTPVRAGITINVARNCLAANDTEALKRLSDLKIDVNASDQRSSCPSR